MSTVCCASTQIICPSIHLHLFTYTYIYTHTCICISTNLFFKRKHYLYLPQFLEVTNLFNFRDKQVSIITNVSSFVVIKSLSSILNTLDSSTKLLRWLIKINAIFYCQSKSLTKWLPNKCLLIWMNEWITPRTLISSMWQKLPGNSHMWIDFPSIHSSFYQVFKNCLFEYLLRIAFVWRCVCFKSEYCMFLHHYMATNQ